MFPTTRVFKQFIPSNKDNKTLHLSNYILECPTAVNGPNSISTAVNGNINLKYMTSGIFVIRKKNKLDKRCCFGRALLFEKTRFYYDIR